ncbi:unnamed protein product [Protopolystoma xenopodis]|uniref:Palmitoyltransferase n=1 Tax=Protopolystoma xenopodis TaxID=117903 RepID=A0A448WBY7_9PLAT|nr:unnamed protein product [Protopolystoma xenopodis]
MPDCKRTRSPSSCFLYVSLRIYTLISQIHYCVHSTASAISVQCDRAEMILWPLLTWRLPHHDSGYPYLPLSHLLHHRNSGGQTAIDLARNLPAPKRLIYLLKFAVCQTQLPIGLPVFRILCSLFSSNLLLRLSFFNRIYSAVWWIHALAPLLFTFLTYSTINSPLTDWTTSSACLTGLFGLASLICLQRHRMADGTRRANPVYIGYLVAGFLALLTSYWNDLLPALSKYSIAARLTPFGVWLVSLITSFWCLLFIKLALLPQPDLKVDSAYTSEKFASLAAAEASHVISRVEGLATCIYQKFIHSDDGAINIDLLEYLDKEIGDIARLYCPECHLIRPSDHNVKHCRLCDTCCFDFDHHCIFLMRCVTRSNQATFILFLFVSWIGFAFYVSLAFLVLSLHCICGHSVSLTGDWKISCLVLVTPRGLLMLLFSFAMTIWLSFFLRNQQIAYRTSKSNNNIGLIRQMLNQCGFARLTAIFCSSGRASPLRLV